jgi:hypothetical protein
MTTHFSPGDIVAIHFFPERKVTHLYWQESLINRDVFFRNREIPAGWVSTESFSDRIPRTTKYYEDTFSMILRNVSTWKKALFYPSEIHIHLPEKIIIKRKFATELVAKAYIERLKSETTKKFVTIEY